MHGGPGTGKSNVIKIIKTEVFEKVLRHETNVHFHVVALQNVMADLFGGDRIHHALNLTVYAHRNESEASELKKQPDVAKQLLQWRWLIIDEISMVSAALLAEVDCKLRARARANSPFTKHKNAKIHQLGGLNIIMSGDLWQLPPPNGGFLGDIPEEFIRDARKFIEIHA